MGKGQRARASRAGEKEANRILMAKEAKKKKVTKIISTVVAIVLVIGIVGGITLQSFRTANMTSGKAMRNAVVLQSENFEVNAAMMSYFFYTQYNNFLNSYGDYVSYLSLDTKKSLKSQDCTMSEDVGSWYDYFVDQAATQAKELVYLAENAVAEKMELTKDDLSGVEATIDAYKDAAAKNNLSLKDFIPAAFGTGVNESDVRDCVELSLLAEKYLASFQNGLKYTDKEIDAFYKKNEANYRYVDYYYYTISASDTKDKATYSAAEKAAKELAAVKDTDAFSAWVEDYERKNAKLTDDYKKEDLESDIKDTLADLVVEGATYVKEDKGSEWLFNKAKVGDTYISDSGNGNYTVYFSTATPYRDSEVTRTIRQIILTSNTHGSMDEANKVAKDVMKSLADKKLTDEAFEELAASYSEDTATYANGGLCENYSKNDFGTEVGEWAYKKDRKKGDFEMIKMTDGYALCYYVGKGVEGWKADCINAMKSEDYSNAKEDWEKKITLTENDKNYKKIPDIVA